MKMTLNDKHSQKPEQQSRWEARLGRKRSSEKMSFKLLPNTDHLNLEIGSGKGLVR
jgi:hypothetical protein